MMKYHHEQDDSIGVTSPIAVLFVEVSGSTFQYVLATLVSPTSTVGHGGVAIPAELDID